MAIRKITKSKIEIKKELKIQTIILISNFIILLLSANSFIYLHRVASELQNEITYREINKPFLDIEYLINNTTYIDDNPKIIIDNSLYIYLILILILIFNNWYYINNKIFELYNLYKQTN